MFDLSRANLPHIVHWDYKQKHEVSTLNPIVDLTKKIRAPGGGFAFGFHFEQLYRNEWM
jgi:hypothetical protein